MTALLLRELSQMAEEKYTKATASSNRSVTSKREKLYSLATETYYTEELD